MKSIFLFTLPIVSLLSFSAGKASAYFTATTEFKIAQFTIANQSSEAIVNGNFHRGLENWGYGELVNLVDDQDFGRVVSLGSGTVDFESSTLSQVVLLKNTKKYFLYLAYKLNQSEVLQGFDEPSFLILINGRPIFTSSTHSTDWQQLTLPIPKGDLTELKIIVQNTADALKSPQLQIAYLSTDRTFSSQLVHDLNLTIPAETIEKTIPIEDISLIGSQFGEYLKFKNPPTQFPIFKYEITIGEQLPTANFTLKTIIGNLRVPIANINSVDEILLLPPITQPGSYQVRALDAHDRVLADGEFLLESN